MARLVRVIDGAVAAEYPLADRRVRFGAGSDCHIVLETWAVGRTHFVIEPLPDGGHRFCELGSGSGTVFNGRQIGRGSPEGLQQLRSGDLIQPGRAPGVFVYLEDGDDLQLAIQRAAPPPLRAQLARVVDGAVASVYPLSDRPFVVGSDPRADLVLEPGEAGSRHFSINPTPDRAGHTLEDLDWGEAIRLNGKLTERPTPLSPLSPGDRIEIQGHAGVVSLFIYLAHGDDAREALWRPAQPIV